MRTALICLALVLVIAIGVAWITGTLIDEQSRYTAMKNKCEEFCTVIGEEFGKVTYSYIYDEFTCMCKHTDTVEYDNTTYKLIRLLDYGVVKNVTQ